MARAHKLFDVRNIIDLRDMVKQSAEIYGDLDAFLVKDKSGEVHKVSFLQFQSDINYLGTALCSLGLKGEMIAILSENRYEWCVSYLATVNGTGVVVPLDKELPQPEIKNLLERSDAMAVFCSEKYVDILKENKESLPNLKYIISFDKEISDDEIRQAGRDEAAAIKAAKPAPAQIRTQTPGNTGDDAAVIVTRQAEALACRMSGTAPRCLRM